MLLGDDHWLRMQRFRAPKQRRVNKRENKSKVVNYLERKMVTFIVGSAVNMYLAGTYTSSIEWLRYGLLRKFTHMYTYMILTGRPAENMAVAGIIVVEKAPLRQVSCS